MKQYTRRKRYKAKKLFCLMLIILLCVIAGEMAFSSDSKRPFFSGIMHTKATVDNGWNLILVNSDNYIPDDYEKTLSV